MPKKKVNPEDAVLDFVADSMVGGQPVLADTFLKSEGVQATPAISFLVQRGLYAFLREKRAEDRLKLKVLTLSPGFYKSVAQEKHDPIPFVKPRKLTAAEYAEKREAERARLEEVYEKGAEAVRKIQLALSFYDAWHLPDGTALGDATRGKLLSEASRERLTADGHIKNAAFYEALADNLRDDQIVRDIPLEKAHHIREAVFVVERADAAA